MPLDDLPDRDIDWMPEARPRIHERMELAIFSAGIDRNWQILKELGVEIAAGELLR